MLAHGRSHSCFCNDPKFEFTGYEVFLDTGSIFPQLVGDPHWTQVSTYATDSVAATPNVSLNAMDA